MTETQSIPAGLCQCGCGARTMLSRHDYKKGDIKKGEPRKFIHGHWHLLKRKINPLWGMQHHRHKQLDELALIAGEVDLSHRFTTKAGMSRFLNFRRQATIPVWMMIPPEVKAQKADTFSDLVRKEKERKKKIEADLIAFPKNIRAIKARERNVGIELRAIIQPIRRQLIIEATEFQISAMRHQRSEMRDIRLVCQDIGCDIQRGRMAALKGAALIQKLMAIGIDSALKEEEAEIRQENAEYAAYVESEARKTRAEIRRRIREREELGAIERRAKRELLRAQKCFEMPEGLLRLDNDLTGLGGLHGFIACPSLSPLEELMWKEEREEEELFRRAMDQVKEWKPAIFDPSSAPPKSTPSELPISPRYRSKPTLTETQDWLHGVAYAKVK